MSEDPLRSLQSHTQRALAAAHVIDQQLESPASARVIAAAREFLAAILALAAEQAPPAVGQAPQLPPAEEVPRPIGKGERVIFTVEKVERSGVVQLISEHFVDGRVLHVEWGRGICRVPETACRRVP